MSFLSFHSKYCQKYLILQFVINLNPSIVIALNLILNHLPCPDHLFRKYFEQEYLPLPGKDHLEDEEDEEDEDERSENIIIVEMVSFFKAFL